MQQHGWIPDTRCQVKGARCKGLHSTRFHVHCFCGRQSLGTEEQVNSGSQKSRGELITGKYRGFGGGDTVFKCAVGYVTIYVCQNLQWSERCSVMSDSLWPHGLYSPWNSPGQNTAVSSHSLLQGIFPTQGLNPSLLHCRRILYQLSHQGNPKTCRAIPFKKWILLYVRFVIQKFLRTQ